MPMRVLPRRVPPSVLRTSAALVLVFVSLVGTARAQVDDGWGSDAELCPRMVGMYTTYNQEPFTGTAVKDYETFFWGRYAFTAHNQGGLGPIEMSGFFYISKAQCYYQGGRGSFIVVSPVIEYYGPRRDGLGECGAGGETELVEFVYEPGYNPYANEPNRGGCGGGGDGSAGGGGSSDCQQKWVIVEKSDDGGNTWYTIYEGWATVCA